MHSACVALLFFISACSSHTIRETVSCCSPSELQGYAYSSGIVFQSGQEVSFYGNSWYYYSEVQQKIATLSYILIPSLGNLTVQVKTLQDYTTSRKYTVTNGMCNITSLPGPFARSCLPSNAVSFGSLKLGSPTQYLTVNSYQYTASSAVTKTSVESMKYQETSSCYDVVVSVSTRTLGGTLISNVDLAAGNHQTTISNTDVFNVPSECTNNSFMKEKELLRDLPLDFMKYII
ncbi:uncharacterized protein LOC133205105 [Saccostrea echinata]|uniref:uncharacterized protein LOC133205105 n=1 Tax=Saccostrea echinata TaxID=191078 RepID=UPI002A806D10|nr:uncharacterized protein LOC133205105 [Saccostrea echinata]